MATDISDWLRSGARDPTLRQSSEVLAENPKLAYELFKRMARVRAHSAADWVLRRVTSTAASLLIGAERQLTAYEEYLRRLRARMFDCAGFPSGLLDADECLVQLFDLEPRRSGGEA